MIRFALGAIFGIAAAYALGLRMLADDSTDDLGTKLFYGTQTDASGVQFTVTTI